MRYYIFAKKNDLSRFGSDWYSPVVIKDEKYIYQTTELDLALLKWDELYDHLKVDEIMFLVADFGINNVTKHFGVTYINTENNYLPFFVIKCSDDHYFNYEETHNMKNVKIIVIQNGIHQLFFDPVRAFEKYDYYKRYRIDATLAIEYTNKNDQINTVPVSTIKGILFHEYESYIKRLGFEPLAGYHLLFGRFWIKNKEPKEETQVEA